MTPATMDMINSLILPTVVAGITFLLGHFHVLLKSPVNPVSPVTVPSIPSQYAPIGQGGILQMLNDVLPHTAPGSAIAPIGQGGILQLAGMTVQAIMAGSGTPSQKAAAAAQITEATSTILLQKAVS